MITYEDYIYACYNSRGRAYSEIRTNGESLESTKAFQKYMKIDLTKEIIEIPCAYKYIINEHLFRNIVDRNNHCDILYIPLICASDRREQEVKSASPLLKSLFYCSYGNMLKYKVGSGTTYIGGEGLIMYEDLTPLLMFTLIAQRIKKEDGTIKYFPLRQVLRINPVIYNNSDLMAKHIKSTMLSKILNMKLDKSEASDFLYRNIHRRLLNKNNLFDVTFVNYNFEIIIDDFSDFFEVPSIPDVNFNNDDVNETLHRNLTLSI